ncbi:MAG: cyclic nucleotide-binding domain-containing protein [Gemmataceae bacterium]
MMTHDLLRGVRVFEGVADDHLEALAAIAEVKEFPANAVVFREGEMTPFIYAVLDGRVGLEVRVVGRGNARIHTVGAGELLGWSPLLQLGPMTATARALTACRLIALRAPQVLALGERSPKFGAELMRRTAVALAQRLNATRLHLLDVFRTEMPVSPPGEGQA